MIIYKIKYTAFTVTGWLHNFIFFLYIKTQINCVSCVFAYVFKCSLIYYVYFCILIYFSFFKSPTKKNENYSFII